MHLRAWLLVSFILACGTLSAAPLFHDTLDLGGSLEREDGFGWAGDPSLLAQGPAWRVGLDRAMTSKHFQGQGYDQTLGGGEVLWGLGSLGSLGLAYHQAWSENLWGAGPSGSSFRSNMGRLGWGWAAGSGFSLGTGLAVGTLSDMSTQGSLTSANLGAHWTHRGQTLGAQLGYSNPGGYSEVGLAGHGAMARWLGYTWAAAWNQYDGILARVGLDTRTAFRLSLGSSFGDFGGVGLYFGLAYSWHGGRLALQMGDRVAAQAFSWQAYEASQATEAVEPDNSPPVIPDVDPAPTAPQP